MHCSHLEAQAGLFALVVANFIFFSYPLLHPDSIDTSNQLLTQIGTLNTQINATTAQGADAEIGRASCRERVLVAV